MATTPTLSRETLAEVRDLLDEVGVLLREIRSRRRAGSTDPELDQRLASVNREYRNLRATLRRREAAHAR